MLLMQSFVHNLVLFNPVAQNAHNIFGKGSNYSTLLAGDKNYPLGAN
jgi:hypothetical protein